MQTLTVCFVSACDRSSKCELAKAMNRQACFQEILKQKDEIILDLDEKLGKLGGVDVAYDSKRRSVCVCLCVCVCVCVKQTKLKCTWGFFARVRLHLTWL